jgi:hypothetical protein
MTPAFLVQLTEREAEGLLEEWGAALHEPDPRLEPPTVNLRVPAMVPTDDPARPPA